jgi:hypothetical protein
MVDDILEKLRQCADTAAAVPVVPQKTEQELALDVVAACPSKCYLGGSRRMAERAPFRITVTDSTDYDYYVTHSASVLSYFLANGFDYAPSSRGGYYLDDEAVDIVQRGPVQVVLRHDAEFYYDVFETIDSRFYYEMLWKSSPVVTTDMRKNIQPIFNALFQAAHSREDS